VEEFIQRRLVEALHEPIGLRQAYSGVAELVVTELHIQSVRKGILAAEFMSIIRQNHIYQKPFYPDKRENIIMANRYCCLWLFGGVQDAKGLAVICIHNRVQVDMPHALEHFDV